MGKIKQIIKKMGYSPDYISIFMEDGLLCVRFPVMGSQHGWRTLRFETTHGHKAIGNHVTYLMRTDEGFSRRYNHE